MEVKVMEVTSDYWIALSATFTLPNKDIALCGISKVALYRAEHSPIRCKIFWIEMHDIPSFVSTHLVRHKIGVEHFVQTGRDDRNKENTDERTRVFPVRHGMFINAQALIFMSRKRLCNKAHPNTQQVMEEIRKKMHEVDPFLAMNMVSECVYRGFCPELKSCGKANGTSIR